MTEVADESCVLGRMGITGDIWRDAVEEEDHVVASRRPLKAQKRSDRPKTVLLFLGFSGLQGPGLVQKA